jgi:hypothetical protein
MFIIIYHKRKPIKISVIFDSNKFLLFTLRFFNYPPKNLIIAFVKIHEEYIRILEINSLISCY